MASPRHPNYLRANRKRLGLSQHEVAYLLGVESGAKVCRHERFAREPCLEALLAYEAIFQRPIRELFAGLFQRIEEKVVTRARKLRLRTINKKSTLRIARKREILQEIAARQPAKTLKRS
jgi:transcriptional regulator with XRE-family HTH domain